MGKDKGKSGGAIGGGNPNHAPQEVRVIFCVSN